MKYSSEFFVIISLLVLSACAKKVDVKTQAVKTQAHEVYFQGMKYYDARFKEPEANLLQAIEYFRRSIEIDSTFAIGYAGLAYAYSSIGGSFNILPPEETWPKAKEAAEKALALDKGLAEAHVSLATVKQGYEWDWTGAEKELKHALELKPNSVEILYRYTDFLIAMNRRDEAIALTEKANLPMPWSILVEDHTEKAIKLVMNMIDSDPNNPDWYWSLALIYAREGAYEEAIKQLKIQIPLMKGDVVDEVALLGHIYGRMGRKEDAFTMLKQLDELSEKGRYVSPVLKAWIYSGLNDNDEAFTWLLRGYETHAHRMGLDIKFFAFIFDPIREDPRFKTLMQKMNLEL